MSEIYNLLTKQAIAYNQAGYPVIPTANKKSLISSWQHEQSSDQSLINFESWFQPGNADQIAILCNKNSVVCIDLDNSEIVTQFKTLFPHLLNTWCEQSPRGQHYFYSVPNAIADLITARKYPGLEIRWKQYTVTAPSEGYQTLQGMKHLSDIGLDDIAHIMAWGNQLANNENVKWTPAQGKQSQSNDNPITAGDHSRNYIKHLERVFYRYTEKFNSRNSGLFSASTWARDHHIAPEIVTEKLESLFVKHPGLSSSANESERARIAEFKRTLTSAYEQPARPAIKSYQLTDRIRETLSKRGLTCLWRTLEALYHAGYRPGDEITRSEAIEHANGVGRDSILRSLEIMNESDQTLFYGWSENLSPQTPHSKSTNVAIKDDFKSSKKCVFVGGSKPVKSLDQGRPAYVYTVPGLAIIRSWLGLKGRFKAVSYIPTEALGSVKETRAIFHKRLIEKRPGQYHRAWLADRIGKSISTIKRYDKLMGITATTQFREIPLSLWNFNSALGYVSHPGYFLMDRSGKKYPALYEIAQEKLEQGVQISLWEQLPSFYQVNTPVKKSESVSEQIKHDPQSVIDRWTKLFNQYPPEQKQPVKEQQKPSLDALETITAPANPLNDLKSLMDGIWEQLDLAGVINYEAGAQGINLTGQYAWLDKATVTSDPDLTTLQRLVPGLSAKNAVRLISKYGYERVLSTVNRLIKRDNVNSLPGLLVTVLRSEDLKKTLGAIG